MSTHDGSWNAHNDFKYYCLSVHLPTCACESASTDIVKVIRNNTHWSTSTGGCCKEPKPYREHLKLSTSVQNRVHAIDCHDLQRMCAVTTVCLCLKRVCRLILFRLLATTHTDLQQQVAVANSLSHTAHACQRAKQSAHDGSWNGHDDLHILLPVRSSAYL